MPRRRWTEARRVGHVDASAWIAAVSALVAVAAVCVSVWQARIAAAQRAIGEQQTALQRQIREDAAQPYVWADFRSDDERGHLMILIVKNEGPTVATGVTIAFDPPLPESWRAGELPVGPSGPLASMPPGRHMRWNLGASFDMLADDLPQRFRVTINGRGPYGPFGPLQYHLDLADYKEASGIAPGTLHGVTEAVKSLTEVLQREQQD